MSRDERATVMIVAPRDDLHAAAVAQRLGEISEGRATIQTFDRITFPAASMLSYELMPTSTAGGGLFASEPLPEFHQSVARGRSPVCGTRIAQDEIRSVWWRRPRPPLPTADVDHQFTDFVLENSTSALLGWLDVVAESAQVINPPDAERRANRKLLQMDLASREGLRVPETFIGNDVDAARRFIGRLWDAGEQIIYKQLRPKGRMLQYTRRLEGQDLERLHQVRHTPVILQREIANGTEVRVVVLDGHIWAATSEPQEDLEVPDIRVAGRDVRHEQVEVPLDVAARIRRFQRRLGLRVGIYDFLIDATGDWNFLEINPSGQWLFVEVAVGVPLAEAFAHLLWFDRIDLDRLGGASTFTDAALRDLVKAPIPEEVVERALAEPAVAVSTP